MNISEDRQTMTRFSVSDSGLSDDSYGQLLQSVEPKKITTEKAYKKFVALLENLLEREEDDGISEQEGHLLELLLVLVQDYEAQTVTFPHASPLEVLHHLMDSSELKQSSLVGIIGSSGVVSEIVNGKREISKAQARNLGKMFNVSYKLFL